MLSDQAVVAESQLNWERMRIEEKKRDEQNWDSRWKSAGGKKIIS